MLPIRCLRGMAPDAIAQTAPMMASKDHGIGNPYSLGVMVMASAVSPIAAISRKTVALAPSCIMYGLASWMTSKSAPAINCQHRDGSR